MAFINLKKKEIQAKIVYYGPGRGGKTTNLIFLHNKFKDRLRSEMVTIKTQGDRTLFFDFFPFDIGQVKGYDIRIQLYTVPGQAKYDSSRQIILRGADGIVFVADSMVVKKQKNISSYRNLIKHMNSYKKPLGQIPWVLQCNKIDLAEQGINLMPPETITQDMQIDSEIPTFAASALHGTNVVKTLKTVIALTVNSLKEHIV
jgi:signal recognition particle receptor subunit beta